MDTAGLTQHSSQILRPPPPPPSPPAHVHPDSAIHYDPHMTCPLPFTVSMLWLPGQAQHASKVLDPTLVPSLPPWTPPPPQYLAGIYPCCVGSSTALPPDPFPHPAQTHPAHIHTGSLHTLHMSPCPPPLHLHPPGSTLRICLLFVAGLAQHSSQVLPPSLHISTLKRVDDLSSSSWQMRLRKSWNGDFLVLTPAQTGNAALSSAVDAAAANQSFARLAALLR